jgi:hypothetical protein
MNNYWAQEDADALVGKLKSRRGVTGFVDHPMRSVWSRSYNAYYSDALTGDSSSGLSFQGENNQLVECPVNETRSLIRQFVSLITKNRLSFDPIVASSDTVTLSDSRVAKNLCEWTVLSKNVDIKADRFAESAAIFGTGFMGVIWRSERGEPFTAEMETGRKVNTGDIDIINIGVEDIFFDWTVPSWEQMVECEFRERSNKYDLAAKYPKFENEITGQSEHDILKYTTHESDMICVYHWFHKPTLSMPTGRYVVSLEDGTILEDQINPYGSIPIVPCVPESFQANMFWGFPKICSLLGLQESLQTVWSANTSNLSSLGIQSVLVPDGSGINYTDIGSLRFISYNPAVQGKIEPLQLVQNAPDSYNYIDKCRSYMTELSGLNGALRGAPPPGITSGVALTVLSSNALEFAQSFSKTWQSAMEQVMTLVLEVFKRFAKYPQQLPVAGKNNQSIIKNFVGSDLANIKRVKVSISNPAQLTTGGRIALAEQLLTNGLLKTPSEYMELIFTGSLEAAVDQELDSLNLIYSETDDLRAGLLVHALSTDTHADHIRVHLNILNDPEIRRLANRFQQGIANPPDVEAAYKVTQNVLSHVLEHRDLLGSVDPVLRAIVETGQAPQQMPAPEQAPNPQLPPPPEQGAV